VAYQRLEEAKVLFRTEYYRGTIYLAGYAVECMLKTLILNSISEKDQESIEAEFRGQRAHNYEWLRNRYVQTNPPLPPEISSSLAFVRTWETSLRYEPGMGDRKEAVRFMAETQNILDWANDRI